MPRPTTPLCYCCHEKPARKGQHFCTDKCAALWAEELAKGNEVTWCPEHLSWEYFPEHKWICEYARKVEDEE